MPHITNPILAGNLRLEMAFAHRRGDARRQLPDGVLLAAADVDRAAARLVTLQRQPAAPRHVPHAHEIPPLQVILKN